MFADTTRSAEMRNEVPHSVHDPFLYIEHGGKRYTVLRSLEVARMSELPSMTALPQEEFGLDELVASGLSGEQAALEIALRACRRWASRRRACPPRFPVELADHLRAGGVELTVDAQLFRTRRRVQERAAAGRHPARADRRRGGRRVGRRARCDAAVDGDGGLLLDGAPLTCERLKEGVALAFIAQRLRRRRRIVAHGYADLRRPPLGLGPGDARASRSPSTSARATPSPPATPTSRGPSCTARSTTSCSCTTTGLRRRSTRVHRRDPPGPAGAASCTGSRASRSRTPASRRA